MPCSLRVSGVAIEEAVVSPALGVGTLSADRRDIVFSTRTWRRVHSIIMSEEKVPPSIYACTPTANDHMEVKLRKRPLTGLLNFAGIWADTWLGDTYDASWTQIGTAKQVTAGTTKAYKIEKQTCHYFEFDAPDNT